MRKNNDDNFDGFMINVFFDKDGDYLAHLVELPNVSAFGPIPAEALAELRTAWQSIKESYQAAGEPVPQAPSQEDYEGPLNVPVDAHLYCALVDEAAKTGMSLYALVAQKLSEPISAKDSRKHLSRKLNSETLSSS